MSRSVARALQRVRHAVLSNTALVAPRAATSTPARATELIRRAFSSRSPRGAVARYVVTSFGPDRPGIVSAITRQVVNARGNVESSRMARLHGDFTISMLVSFALDGSTAESVEKFTSALAAIEGLTTSVRESSQIKKSRTGGMSDNERVAYKRILLRGTDFPGLTNTFAEFLAARNINIESMSTDTQPASFGQEDLFIIEALVKLTSDCEVKNTKALAVALETLERNLGVDIEVLDHEPIV
jgi:glycine cleavage system transcriptional repressor